MPSLKPLSACPRPRFFYIPISDHCVESCVFCEALGCCRESTKDLFSIERSLDKAIAGEFSSVVFSSDLINHSDLDKILSLTKSRNLEVILQFPAAGFVGQHHEPVRNLLSRGVRLNLLVGRKNSAPLEVLEKANSLNPTFYITLLAENETITESCLDEIPVDFHERVFFYFPLKAKSSETYLTCPEIFALLGRLHHKFPLLQFRPPLGQDIWDRRVSPSLSLEPNIMPSFSSQTDSPSILFSVIIPTYDNRKHLMATLSHLARQDLDRNNFEIIVVDDGSTDSTGAGVKTFLASEKESLNLKYIFSPRPSARAMGDANYRAGVSRNLGVKNSSGEFICFLDSDILVPNFFLNDLLKKHADWDVIQCKRYNLTRTASRGRVRYENIYPSKDVFHLDEYRQNFFQTSDWMEMENFWKYTCTYGLSMRKDRFKSSGWIKRNFIFYGFEDVDLGYRLFQDGCRFLLSDVVTYHLFHETSRSEFYNDSFRRKRLLSNTAQIFYLNTLDPRIFNEFIGYMVELRPERNFILGKAYRYILSHLFKYATN